MWAKGGSGNTSNYKKGLDRAFVHFQVERASKEAGYRVLMPKDVGNDTSICSVCGQEFKSSDTFKYVEHYKAEHPRWVENYAAEVRKRKAEKAKNRQSDS